MKNNVLINILLIVIVVIGVATCINIITTNIKKPKQLEYDYKDHTNSIKHNFIFDVINCKGYLENKELFV